MMSNTEKILEIQQKIAELQKEYEVLKEQDKKIVIQDVKEKINTYGLTAEECGFTISTNKPKDKTKTNNEKKPAKYRRGPEELWTGGRGRKPAWVNEVKKNGEDIEKYRII